MTNLSQPAAQPRSFQFRIATLLIAMVWVGLISLSLRNPTQIWSSAVGLATLLSSLTAIIVAVYRGAQTRAMAIGFVVFSLGFFNVTTNNLQIYQTPITGPLRDLFDVLFDKIHAHSHAGSAAFSIPTRGPQEDPFAAEDYLFRSRFAEICKNALACLFGVVGAILAQILYATQRREPTESRSVSP